MVGGTPGPLPGENVAVLDHSLTQPEQLCEVNGKRLCLLTHLWQHCPQEHRGTHGRQGILRPDDQRRGRLSANSLQGSENLDDLIAAIVER